MIERYVDPTIAEIWNRQAEIRRWLLIETVAMRYNPLAGEAWRFLSEMHSDYIPTPDQVSREEKGCGHEVVAFLRALSHVVTDPETKRWLHYGLTSSDLVDTGLGIALTTTGNSIKFRLDDLYTELEETWWKLGDCPDQVGRTHGQVSVLRPAAHPWRVASNTLYRIGRRLDRVREELRVGKLSGPAGAHPHAEQRAVLDYLGLKPVDSTQIVPRDSIAAFASLLADLATFCEGIVLQIRLLSQTGIQEVREGRIHGQVGSSAMPHKTNPIRSENICGLARLARATAEPIRLGLAQWGDRDLAHSSVERVALPDLCHLAATVLRRTTTLVRGLEWDRDRIRHNARQAEQDGSAFSYERVMELQGQGMSYLEAHRQVTDDLDRPTGMLLDPLVDFGKATRFVPSSETEQEYPNQGGRTGNDK